MLDRINTIDWQSMGASRIPQWIRDLVSENSDIRIHAGWKLQEYLHYYVESIQDYYDALATDAPVLITPFLIEILQHDLSDKEGILYLLDILAHYHLVDELRNPYKLRANQIYQQLLPHFELFLPFLENPDAATRTQTTYLLSRFEEKTNQVMSILLYRIEQGIETNILGRQCIAEIICKKLQHSRGLEFSERFVNVLRTWLSANEESLQIRATAAYNLVCLQVNDVDVSAVKMLIDILRLPEHEEFSAEVYYYAEALKKLDERYISEDDRKILDKF